MEVKLRPPFHGCLIALLSLMTLGLFPLLRRMGERHFIKSMSEDGIVTRGGRRIAWADITHVRRTIGTVQGVAMSDEFKLRSRKGSASLPTWRAANAEEAQAYFLAHLPPTVEIG